MRPETGTCTFPLCGRKEEKNGFCFLHKIYSDVPAEKKVAKPIPQKSEKRKVEQKEYVKIVKEMLKANPSCEIKETGCLKKATGLHHKQKRSPKNFLQKSNLMRACDNCQLWVENNPLESIEKGYSISKYKLKINEISN